MRIKQIVFAGEANSFKAGANSFASETTSFADGLTVLGRNADSFCERETGVWQKTFA